MTGWFVLDGHVTSKLLHPIILVIVTIALINFRLSIQAVTLDDNSPLNGELSWYMTPSSYCLKNQTITIDMPECSPVAVSCPYDRRKFVPIFIMTRDRVTVLKLALESFRKLVHVPYRVIILDQDSTYRPMVDFLESIPEEYNVETVHRLKKQPVARKKKWQKNRWKESVKEASAYIQDYLDRNEGAEYYIFTDPDISLINTHPDLLLFYMSILQSCLNIQVLGPGLPISDIPKSYPLLDFVYNDSEHFWIDRVPNMAIWNGYGYHLVAAPIDTTFQMRRRSTPFQRFTGPSFRTFAPYAAKHLDWYVMDELIPTVNTSAEEFQTEKQWYRDHQMGVNHYTTAK